MTTTHQIRTPWHLTGQGYEFCNCNAGCTCNFAGFPSSSDGSCKALVVTAIESGNCGEVDLSGITAAAVLDWPKAIHDGGGKAVFVVPQEVPGEAISALAQIFTGALGGQPWEILGNTYEVEGLLRAPITIKGQGLDATVTIDGVGTASGHYLANPVTGERHEARIVLPEGFIWKEGNCGIGSFDISADGIELSFGDSNWILYDFDWSN